MSKRTFNIKASVASLSLLFLMMGSCSSNKGMTYKKLNHMKYMDWCDIASKDHARLATFFKQKVEHKDSTQHKDSTYYVARYIALRTKGEKPHVHEIKYSDLMAEKAMKFFANTGKHPCQEVDWLKSEQLVLSQK